MISIVFRIEGDVGGKRDAYKVLNALAALV
jgi:hypothetical protein